MISYGEMVLIMAKVKQTLEINNAAFKNKFKLLYINYV